MNKDISVQLRIDFNCEEINKLEAIQEKLEHNKLNGSNK